MPLWIIALAALVLVLGIVLLRRGLKGIALDDHPICRRCGFDLFGLPDGAAVCSECGADLSSRRAIRIGTRKRRPGMATLGVLLIAVILFNVGVLGLGMLNGVRWIEYAPAWYLLRQCKSPLAAERDAAIDELYARISSGALANEQVQSVVDLALAAQADLSKTWETRWGDVIDAAHAANKLPAEKWRQYVLNSAQFQLVVRPEVRRGDDLIVRIVHLPGRCGSKMGFEFWMDTDIQPSDLVSLEKNKIGGRIQSGNIGSSNSGSVGHRIVLDPKLVAAAPDGEHTLHMQIKVDLDYRPAAMAATQSSSKIVDLAATWKLVAADAPTVKGIEDVSFRAAVEKAISVQRVATNPQNANYISMGIDVRNPPVPIAYKVVLRSGSREWPVGGIYVPANSNSSWGAGGAVKNFDADVVDVVFRPDERTALDTVDMHEYWKGEVVIRNVKVTRPPPTTRAR